MKHFFEGKKRNKCAVEMLGILFPLFCVWNWAYAADEALRGDPGVTGARVEIRMGDLPEASVDQVTPQNAVRPRRPKRQTHYKPLPADVKLPQHKPGNAQSTGTTLSSMPATTSKLTAQSEAAIASTTATFAGVNDNGWVDYPNTQGAVGPNHLMVATDSQIRYQNRSGGEIRTVSTESFWAPIGGTNVFDVRLLYEPYGQRWIMSADAFPQNPPTKFPPLLLVAVSKTIDPGGTWNLYKVDCSRGFTCYPDLPNLGFNKNWIVVQSDMYSMSTDLLQSSDIYVFNKASLYSGGSTGAFTYFTLDAATDLNGQVPAATYDAGLDVEYLMAVLNPNYAGLGYLRVYEITGPVGSEALVMKTYPQGYSYWDAWADQPNNLAFLPQLGTSRKINAENSRLLNLVFREGLLWTTHTIFLPTSNPNRAGVQYWGILPRGGEPIKLEVIQDINSTYHYAFPSIAVNRNTEILLGYTRFSPNDYPSAAYSFCGGLPLDLLQPPVVLKSGEATFLRTNYTGAIKWGKYSASVPDPLNDTEFWTIQEYAAAHATPGDASRWGTWWGRVTPPVDLALGVHDNPNPVAPGGFLTYNLYVTNFEVSQVEGVLLTNTLSPDVTFVSVIPSRGNCTTSNGVVVCNLGKLGDLAVATVSITVSALKMGYITNLATVSARGMDKNNVDNTVVTVTQVGPNADLGLRTTATPNPGIVGERLTCLLTLTNNGPNAAFGIYATNTLPEGATLISSNASMGTVNCSGNKVIWAVETLNAHAVQTLSLMITLSIPGDVTNSAIVTATTNDPNLANNRSTTWIWVLPREDSRLENSAYSEGTFSVSVQTILGMQYYLEYKNSLDESNWTALPPILGDGGLIIFTDAVEGSQRFYRLRIE